MIRSRPLYAVLGSFAGLLAFYLFADPTALNSTPAGNGNATAESAIPAEPWPICTSTDVLAEGPAWAPLDPDFIAGKRALAAGDWNAAVAALTPLVMRDDRNADAQNYLGYAYRRLRQFEPAFGHYRQALALNPRHRGAHGHIGEAYLASGNLTSAKEHLAALERICLVPCEEYDHLKAAIASYQGWITH